MLENKHSHPEGDGADPKETAGEVTLLGGSRLGKWLDNFWYHYKVQFLAVLFLLVVLTVCVVQCATRPKEADLTLCYAGRKSLMASSSNTAVADMGSSLSDYLPNGTDTTDVIHYLIDRSSTDPTVQNFSQTNLSHLRDELNLANVYIYLLDESLYLDYANAGESHYMREVSPLLNDRLGTLELTEDGRGVYLRSTPLASLPGFSTLPEDTVLCLRVQYSAFALGSGEKTDATYKKCEALFVSCLTGTGK